MKKIKKILFILFLVVFIALIVILLLLPSTTYERFSDELFDQSKPSNTVETPKNLPRAPAPNKPSNKAKTASKLDSTTQTVEGFDWRLPNYAQRSDFSGLVSETRGSDAYVRADFHMVRWDKTNPQQNVYDFSELENKIRSRSKQQVLLRLETYGKCETPNWALKQLQTLPDGTLIFWQDRYLTVLKPYIKKVAALVQRYPQIIGVQIGIADGQYREDACDKFHFKDGWGEFNLKPDELTIAQNQYGLTPALLEQSTKRIIDLYADEFGSDAYKLIFNNFDQFSWLDIATPYNAKMPSIAKYALSLGVGNRDGQIEHWMRYIQKGYGMVVAPSSNSTCALEMDEPFAKRFTSNRYWGTENEEFGDYYWVRNVYGSAGNQPHRFFTSSLRTLQMRRNYMTVHAEAMQKLTDPVYKIQDFLRYLDKTLGKTIADTPDAFILLGERYVSNHWLTHYPETKQCQAQGGTAFRSYGRWISERSDSKPTLKITFPKNDKRWGQDFYLPQNINYEYAARASKQFNFDLNDELRQTRCNDACNVAIKVSYKDDSVSNIWITTAEGESQSIKTTGDGRIKTSTFTLRSGFQDNSNQSDITLQSDSAALSVILLRINFLED